MDTYLTIFEAAKITHVSTQVLKELVENGRIKSVMLSTGEYLVSEKDIQARVPLNKRPEYVKYSHLAGICIGISEAARKYGIPQQTISRWIAKDFIKRLGQDGRKTLIDESEIATYAEIYKSHAGGQGKWIFERDGSIYSKKSK